MSPPQPVGPKAHEEEKATILKNIVGKGCAPRKALPRIDLSNLSSDVKEFVARIPIGGIFPIGPRLKEWQEISGNYIKGQILPGRRKSMEPITKRILDGDYQQMQQFITDSPWDADATMNATMIFCRDEMASPDGVFIFDDTGMGKQGNMSPGVARQYFSETKNIGNCQVAVTGVYAKPIGPSNADMVTWALGMRLYIPKAWDDDELRRQSAGIPAEVRYTKKWRLALDIVSNARDLKVPHRCILADTWYGKIPEFRAKLREWTEPYLLAMPMNELHVVPEDTPILLPGADGNHVGRPRTKPFLPDGVMATTPGRIAKEAKDWTEVCWGEGTKGRLNAKFVRRMIRVCLKGAPTEEIGWLLIEDGADGLKAYLCWGLDGLSVDELVKLAHCRWAIEAYHETIKDQLGFDHFEGRKYRGWQHHAVLTQMAFALLEWLRLKRRGADEEVSLPTLPEVRRILIGVLVDQICSRTQKQEDHKWNHCKDCPLREMIIEAG